MDKREGEGRKIRKEKGKELKTGREKIERDSKGKGGKKKENCDEKENEREKKVREKGGFRRDGNKR